MTKVSSVQNLRAVSRCLFFAYRIASEKMKNQCADQGKIPPEYSPKQGWPSKCIITRLSSPNNAVIEVHGNSSKDQEQSDQKPQFKCLIYYHFLFSIVENFCNISSNGKIEFPGSYSHAGCHCNGIAARILGLGEKRDYRNKWHYHQQYPNFSKTNVRFSV